MRLLTVFPIALVALLGGCQSKLSAPAQFVAEEQHRATEYHALSAKIKADQAEMNDHVNHWLAVCKAKGQVLTMDVTGDPGCADDKKAATGADQNAVGMKGTVQVPAK